MIATVAILNVMIALFCFYMAFRIWKVRRTLTRVADTLLVVERRTHAALHNAPEAILQGRVSSRQARQTYQQLEVQLQRARQALALLGLGQQVWKWQGSQRAARWRTSGGQATNRSSRRVAKHRF